MKSISRFTIIALIILSLSLSALEACPGLSFGARGNYLFPTGKEAEFTKSAYGFDVFAAYRLFKVYQIGVIMKYTLYNPLNVYPGYTETLTATDFFAFLDYYFWGDDYDDDCGFSPYAGLQFGKSYYNQSQEYLGKTFNYDRNTLVWGLHVGTDYKISKNFKLNFNLDYLNYNYPTPEKFFNAGLGIRFTF